MQVRTPRLTELASLAGCAAKASPGMLAEVLRSLADTELVPEPPELIADLAQPDGAAVHRLDDHRALIVTLDLFAPIVDDPFDYGAIAAATRGGGQ